LGFSFLIIFGCTSSFLHDKLIIDCLSTFAAIGGIDPGIGKNGYRRAFATAPLLYWVVMAFSYLRQGNNWCVAADCIPRFARQCSTGIVDRA
jgi:hypothetical protein